jgi:hypothetical protein
MVNSSRREQSLSRDRVSEASIELLDSSRKSGLRSKSLSERLANGPGAIYWHIDSKSDLPTAACDAAVARTLHGCTEFLAEIDFILRGLASRGVAKATLEASAEGWFSQ